MEMISGGCDSLYQTKQTSGQKELNILKKTLLYNAKGKFHNVGITIMKIRAPNNCLQKKQTLQMQGDTDRNRQLIGDLNTPFPVQNRLSGRNINKDMEEVNNIINRVDLIDLC